MNRRTFLAAASALSAVSLTPRSLLAQSGTPEAGSFPTLEIIVKDDGYTLPATIPAGRQNRRPRELKEIRMECPP